MSDAATRRAAIATAGVPAWIAKATGRAIETAPSNDARRPADRGVPVVAPGATVGRPTSTYTLAGDASVTPEERAWLLRTMAGITARNALASERRRVDWAGICSEISESRRGAVITALSNAYESRAEQSRARTLLAWIGRDGRARDGAPEWVRQAATQGPDALFRKDESARREALGQGAPQSPGLARHLATLGPKVTRDNATRGDWRSRAKCDSTGAGQRLMARNARQ